MLKTKNIPYLILALYFIVTFESYLTLLYPNLSNILLVLSILFITKFTYTFNKKRVFIFIGLITLYLISSTSSTGFSPQRYAVLTPFFAFFSKTEIVRIYKTYINLFIINI